MTSTAAVATVAPFIDGRFTDSRSGHGVEIVNPSTGKPCLCIPVGCHEDVEAAVAACRHAFDTSSWSGAAPSFRKRTLHRFADLIGQAASSLDALDAEEMGKPVGERRANASAAAGLARFYAEALDKSAGDCLPSDSKSFVVHRRVPRGVVAAIVPWNFPTFNAVLKVAPALAAGNCVVLKPSELCSRSALRLAELAVEAGIPPGVLNVVPGLGTTVGRALGLHPQVDMITFTGSTDVGKLLPQYSGQSNMKVVMAECGGKSPQIVFDDGVDLAAASEFIGGMLLANQGQICSLGSRLLVQRSIEAPLLEKIRARLRGVVMGDALSPQTTFGPLASARQLARVLQLIESGHADGAELIEGGHRVRTESGGYFVEPTVFRNVPPSARIAQEEIFGPVLAVIPFDDIQDAIRIANDTRYGLLAYAWTASLPTGLKLANGLRSPVIVNAAEPTGEGPGDAFSIEPAGQSGLGVEGGVAGLESYYRRQLVWVNFG
jgi:acyl-CoA reductase-like NAD-dependent aldehyde dehydrogenase